MKLSKLYGSKIMLTDKKICGTILGICRENFKITGYICFDERENELFAPIGKTRFFKGVPTCREVSKKPRGTKIRLGLPAYTEDGKACGYLTDLKVAGGNIISAVIGKRGYPVGEVAIGDAVIVRGGLRAELAAKDLFIGAVCGGYSS